MAVRGVESSLNDPKYVKALETQIEEILNRQDSVESKVDATSRAPRTVNDTPDVDISGAALPDGGVNPTRRFTPSAPAGLYATAAISFNSGLPFVSISIGYERVTNALAGDPITIARHELQGRGPLGEWSTLTSSSGSATTVQYSPLPVSEAWEFRMRAVSAQGITGPYSETLVFTLPADTTPPPIPSKPYLSARLGTVSVAWDGLTAAGAAMPSDFAFVEVQQSSDDVTFTKVGTLRTLGSYIVTGLPYEDTFYFRLLAVDGSGNRSVAGASDSVVVTPLVDTDTIGLIIDGANIVPGSINAADKIIGETITGGLIQGLAINAGHIQANAITADKILAGSITGIKIAANTITADNLLIGGVNGDNLLEDPGFLVGAPSWSVTGGSGPGDSIIQTGTGAFPRYLHFQPNPAASTYVANNRTIPCAVGEVFAISYLWWNGSGATFKMQVLVRGFRSDGSNVDTVIQAGASNLTTPTTYSYTVPSGVIKLQVIFESYQSNAAVGVALPSVRRKTTGSLLVDGAIDGKTITGAIVRTGTTNPRVQLDSTGLHAYNSAGTEVTTISASTGQVTSLGTFSTGTTGDRATLSGLGLAFVSRFGSTTSMTSYDNGAAGGAGLKITNGLGGTLYVSNIAMPTPGSAAIWSEDNVRFSNLYSTGGRVRGSASGRVTVNVAVADGAGVDVTIALPNEFIPSTGIMTANSGNSRFTCGITSVGPTSAVVRVNNWSGVAATLDFVWWICF